MFESALSNPGIELTINIPLITRNIALIQDDNHGENGNLELGCLNSLFLFLPYCSHC